MINIITQFYRCDDKQRYDEIIFCIRKNLDNNVVKSVHLINEPNTLLPSDIINHEKIKLSVIKPNKKATTIIDKNKISYLNIFYENNLKNNLHKFKNKLLYRMSYEYAFDYANKNFLDGEIIMLINADIFIDDSNDFLSIDTDFFNDDLKCLALSRHEYDGNISYINNISQGEYRYPSMSLYSQDAWCLKTPIRLKNIDFSLGSPSCDNHIIYQLRIHGYDVYNLAFKYKIFHFDTKYQNDPRLKFGYNTDLSLISDKIEKLYLCPYNTDNIQKNNKKYLDDKYIQICTNFNSTDEHKKFHENDMM